MTKVVYHPGTSTYWSAKDEWYVVDVPPSALEGDIEEYLSNLSDESHLYDKCGECGKPTLHLRGDLEEAQHV